MNTWGILDGILHGSEEEHMNTLNAKKVLCKNNRMASKLKIAMKVVSLKNYWLCSGPIATLVHKTFGLKWNKQL